MDGLSAWTGLGCGFDLFGPLYISRHGVLEIEGNALAGIVEPIFIAGSLHDLFFGLIIAVNRHFGGNIRKGPRCSKAAGIFLHSLGLILICIKNKTLSNYDL